MTALFLDGLHAGAAAGPIVRRHGHTEAAAAEQAERLFDALDAKLAQAGCTLHDVCKLTVEIGDRAYRQGVYGVLGRRLAGVFPVSTGLIVKGFFDPDVLVQLDVWVVPGGPHRRLRQYRSTDRAYGLTRQGFVCDFCMAVVADGRVFLRGQTGGALSGPMVGLNDPGAQAAQAIDNVRVLLAEAGADLTCAVKLVIYVTDRAYVRPVLNVVERAFDGAPVASAALIVKGLAAPELLMEIDVHAIQIITAA